MASILTQIVLLDLVFSFDGIATTCGLTDHISVMSAAVVTSIVILIIFAVRIGDFINAHPSW